MFFRHIIEISGLPLRLGCHRINDTYFTTTIFFRLDNTVRIEAIEIRAACKSTGVELDLLSPGFLLAIH